MSENKRPKPQISPRGTAVWPKLDEPDTKFKAEGEYSIKLRVSEKEGETLAQSMQAALDDYKTTDEYKTKIASLVKKNGKAFKPTTLDFFKAVNDDQGEPTGEVEFVFKAKASGKTKAGKEWTRGPIAIFDAKGRRIKVNVGGGSVVKVSYTLMPWINPKGEQGVKLALEAVQVLDLKSWNGRDAEGYGFGQEEGYEADEDSMPGEGSGKGDGEDDDDAAAF